MQDFCGWREIPTVGWNEDLIWCGAGRDLRASILWGGRIGEHDNVF